MDNKTRYYVDWWSIRKSTIYGIIAIVVTIIIALGGVWWLWQNDWMITPPEEREAPKDSASIISFEGNVKIVRVGTRATERVTKSTFVQAGDTVQTQADGRAQIRMIDGSILSVRPNSTVIISDSSSILGGTSVKVKLDDGQIRVKTENQPESSNNVVEIKETENKMLSQSEASFNINSKTNAGEIRINRGGLESNAGGEKVVIKEDEFVSINGGKISSKERLLKAPVLKEPSPSKQITARGTGANVPFNWGSPEGHKDAVYELQLAQSPFFVSGKMVDETSSVKSNNLSIRNLEPGTYFWRVRASIASGQTSDWSEPSKFSIIKKTGSSGLEASDWEVEEVGGAVYIIRGITQSGATVRALQRETFAKSDGSFKIQVSSRTSSVTVGISDEKGNRSLYIISLKTGKVIR